MTFGSFSLTNATADPLVQTNTGGNQNISAAISARAAAGSVGNSLTGGTFHGTGVSGLGAGGAIGLVSGSTMDFVVGGQLPAGFNSVPVSANVRIDGAISVSDPATCHFHYDIVVTIAGATVGRATGVNGTPISNTFNGLTVNFSGGNLTMSGDITTAPVDISVSSTPRELGLLVTAGFGCSSDLETATFSHNFNVTLRTSGPVINVPAVNSITTNKPWVVNNTFTDPFAPPPPSGISFVGTSLTTINCPAGVINVPGNVAISANLAALGIFCPVLTSVGGSVEVSGNTAATGVDLGSLASVGGAVDVSGNTAATGVDISSLGSVGSSVTITNNTGATGVDISALASVGGAVDVSGNTAATGVDISSLTSVGSSVTVTNNTGTASVDLGSLGSVGGNLNVANNGQCTSVLLGPLTTITGNLTLQTCGTGALNTGAGAPGGNTNVGATGYTSITGKTAVGMTTVANRTAEAVMTAELPAGAFTTPVSFSFTRLDPAALPPVSGQAAGGGQALVDPLAAYQFTFGVPFLNSPARLTFDIQVAGLDAATRTALLAAVAAGTATLATLGDAPGSMYQAFPICSGAAVPSAGGCVAVQPMWAAGQPLTGPPTIVRFSNVVGSFSTWAVAIVSPCAGSFSISPLSQSFTAAGGPGSVAVAALAGCGWTGVSNAPWVTVTSGASGAGNGAVNYSVAANTGAARSGSIAIAGLTFTVNQDAAAALPGADLAIAKIALPWVRTGRNLTYLIGAANLGPAAASNVVITDPLPAGTTFVRAFFQRAGCTSTGGAVSCIPPSGGTPCSFANNTVTCTIGTLSPLGPGSLTGISVLLEVNVTAPAGATIRNRAAVSSANPDPRSGNNAATAATLVVR